MARSLARSRPLRQAGLLYRRISQAPPFLLALAIHAGIILILMSITTATEQPEVILTVDVSKVLAEKVERPPEELIQAPETPQDVSVDNPQIDFSAPVDDVFDSKAIGDTNISVSTPVS